MASRWVIAFQHSSALGNAPARPAVRLRCHSAKVSDHPLQISALQYVLFCLRQVTPRPHRARPSGNHFAAEGRVLLLDAAYEKAAARAASACCRLGAIFLPASRSPASSRKPGGVFRCPPLRLGPSMMDRSSPVAIAAIEAELLRIRFATGHHGNLRQTRAQAPLRAVNTPALAVKAKIVLIERRATRLSIVEFSRALWSLAPPGGRLRSVAVNILRNISARWSVSGPDSKLIATALLNP
jgi:hypothetical protein